MRISDWSSDVCSSDLARGRPAHDFVVASDRPGSRRECARQNLDQRRFARTVRAKQAVDAARREHQIDTLQHDRAVGERSEEHTSELQSLMRISYAVFCLKKKKKHNTKKTHQHAPTTQSTIQPIITTTH